MNVQYDFTQTGGFPLDQGVLNDLQNGVLEAEGALASLVGPLAIISGCAVNGNNAANGVVAINGVVMPFVGGAVATKVIVVQTPTQLTYEDGSTPASKITQIATFGDDGVQNNLWANFKSNTTEGVLARLNRLEWLCAPEFIAHGSMKLWRLPHAQIPAGWQEVTDWAGRLLMGRQAGVANFDTGDQGGNAEVVINENNIQQFAVGLPTNDTNLSAGGLAKYVGVNQTSATVAQVLIGVVNPTPIEPNPYRIVEFIEPIPGYIA